MPRQELEIEIDATGAVKVTTHGIKGKQCLDYMEIFRQLLGPVESQELTTEYVEIDGSTENQTQVSQRISRLEF
jgi:hypothetical protein